MKRLFVLFVIIPILVAFTINLPDDHKKTRQDLSTKDMVNSIDKMYKEMAGTKITGNADRDFAHLLIHHHQGGIELADYEMKYGTNQDLKDLAKNVSDRMKSDITNLQEFDNTNKAAATEKNDMDNKEEKDEMVGSAKEVHPRDLIKSMEKKMKTVELVGSSDWDFSALMIAHHQTALDLAEKYMDKIQSKKLKDIANDIIDDDVKDISKLGTYKK